MDNSICAIHVRNILVLMGYTPAHDGQFSYVLTHKPDPAQDLQVEITVTPPDDTPFKTYPPYVSIQALLTPALKTVSPRIDIWGRAIDDVYADIQEQEQLILAAYGAVKTKEAERIADEAGVTPPEQTNFDDDGKVLYSYV